MALGLDAPTLDSVRALADRACFTRGKAYLADERVFNVIRIGTRIRGSCRESMREVCDLTMELREGNIVAFDCECAREGFCEHLVALALFVAQRPEGVLELDPSPVMTRLKELTRDDLIAIILDRATEDTDLLRRLVRDGGYFAKTTPGAGEGRGVRAGGFFRALVAGYRSRTDEEFATAGHDPYGAALQTAAHVQRLLSRADHLTGGDPVRLLAFNTGIYDSLEEHIGKLDDSDGALAEAAGVCTDKMHSLITREQMDPEVRSEWLRDVVPRYLRDDFGLAEGLGVAILAIDEPQEIGVIEDLAKAFLNATREKMENASWGSASQSSEQFDVERACELLSTIYEATSRESEIDSLYLENNLHLQFAMHKLGAGEVPAAVEHAKSYLHEGYDVHRFAEALVDSGEPAHAQGFLVRALPGLSANIPWRETIISTAAEVAVELGNDPEALSLRLQAFEERPSVDTFRATLETARQQGLETEYDHRMVEMLQWDQPGQATQVEIHLYRGDIDAALAAYESTNPFGREYLALTLAEAAAATRPHAAGQLYSEVLERYIARRSRNDYRTAASLLIRLRGVMSDAGFSEYVSDLTQRFNRLSALKDELEKALAHH